MLTRGFHSDINVNLRKRINILIYHNSENNHLLRLRDRC